MAEQCGETGVTAGESPRRCWAWAGGWALLAMGVTALAVAYSLRYGKLSVPADWDDVMYMAYAASRVNDLYTGGLWACVTGWVHNTPHSPYSCGVAFVSFLLVGVRDWPPYAASGLLVFLFLSLADWMTGRQRTAVKVLVGLYLCTIPMVTLAVTDFKPDIAWGIWMAAVAAACVLRPVVGGARRWLLLLGVMCGTALLVKPSTTPGTVALLGVCGVVGTLKDWAIARRFPSVVAMLRAWGIVLGVTLVVAGPFFYLNWAYFDYYIRSAIFGEYAGTWRLAGGWGPQFLYFLTGPGGQTNLGGHLYLMAAAVAAGWVVAAARRDWGVLVRGAGLLVILLACFLLPVVNPAKNPLLASPFFAVLIVSAVYWLGYVAGLVRTCGWRRCGLTAVLVATFVWGLSLDRWTGVYYGPGGSPRADSGRLHGEVYAAVLGQAKPYPQVTTVMATGPVREITLAWYAAREGRSMKFDRPYSDKVADFAAFADRSDFVLAQEDHVLGCVAIMPNEQGHVQSDVLAMMRGRADYKQLSEFTAGDGKKLVLFQRTRWTTGVMSGVRALLGFGPIQGPYPDATPPLPMFCWGRGKASRLLLTPERDGPAVLKIECRVTDRVSTVRVVSSAGAVLGSHQFAKPWTPETFEVPLPAVRGGDEIRLEYEGPKGRPAGGENAAFISKIELTSTGG